MGKTQQVFGLHAFDSFTLYLKFEYIIFGIIKLAHIDLKLVDLRFCVGSLVAATGNSMFSGKMKLKQQ
jgi:hypothetical protein